MFMVSGYCRRWYVYFKRGNSNSVSMLWYLWFYDNLTLGNTEKEVSNNLKSIYFPFFSNISNMKICDISIHLDFCSTSYSICKVKSTFHLITCSIYKFTYQYQAFSVAIVQMQSKPKNLCVNKTHTLHLAIL